MSRLYTIAFTLVILSWCPSIAQTIQGSSFAPGGTFTSYTYTTTASYTNPQWSTDDGSPVSSSVSQSGNTYTYTGSFVFTNHGIANIFLKNGTVLVATRNLQVGTAAPAPSTSFTYTYNCGQTIVTRNTNPPASDIVWYWVTDPASFSTTLGNGPSVTITSATPLYLRAAYTSDPAGYWSTTAQSAGSITIYQPLPAPSSSTDVTAFVGTNVNLSVSSVASATSYRWYTQSSGGTPIAGLTTNSYNFTTSTSNIYYVASTIQNCESSTRKSVAINAITLPQISVVGGGDARVILGSPITLSTGTYDSYDWRNAQNQTIGNSSNVTIAKSGTYKVTVTRTGVQGVGVSTINVLKGQDGQDFNFIVSNKLTAPVADASTIDDLTVNSVMQEVAYFDGLGRPIQTVKVQNSPSQFDEVQPNVYDEFGRETIMYLPYVSSDKNGFYKTNSIADQGNFYQSAAMIAHDAKPYSAILFESSPLNRIREQGSPGASWQPDLASNYTNPTPTDHSNKFSYELNLASEVLLWTYTDPSSTYPFGIISATVPTSPQTPNYYPIDQLVKNRMKDEHNNEVIQYIDKEGHVVLKRIQAVAGSTTINDTNYASTYYIYNVLGNLVCVVPPEAVSRLAADYYQSAATDASRESFLARWTYRYVYDSRNRVILKQLPGMLPLYMVYDGRDRLVLTQDGNQRTSKQWLFTKYDALNRSVLTGILKTDSTLSQAKMQRRVNFFYKNLSGQQTWYEAFQGSGIHGYTNNSYPLCDTLNNYLTVSYYDNYSFKSLFVNNGTFDYRNDQLDGTGGFLAQDNAANSFVVGQLTGMKTRMISSASWLKTVVYYDAKYRIVQKISDNIKGHTITTTTYDFVGKPLRTKTSLYTGQPITWNNITSDPPTISGNTISFTGSRGSDWGQGATSVQYLPANTDGWVEATLSQVNTGVILGLGDGGAPGISTVDFGWYVGTGQLNINRGSNISYGYGNVVPGDVLRIERINGKIYYKKNGVIVYPIGTQAADVSTAQLYFYTTLRNSGAKVDNVVVSNTFSISLSNNTLTTATKRMSYDHAGRLINSWHQLGGSPHLDGSPEVLISHYSYNELGQLVDKKLNPSSSDGADAYQSIDYRYNIRGWLTSINNAELASNDTNDDIGTTFSDFFGLTLAYENDLGTGNSNSKQYNGNISAVKWSNGLGQGSIKAMAYNFTYDAMNRLLNASHKQANTLNTWMSGQFDERGISYDLNGNLKTLRRKGAGRIMIDSLNYDYGTNGGNQLLNVTDLTTATDKSKGFYDGSTSGNDYAYDDNGNLKQDKNKNLTLSAGQSITYNYLNLLERITKYGGNDYINYLYDATGVKHAQVVNQTITQKVTEYVGPFVFEDNQLQFILHDEGKIVIAYQQVNYSTSCDDVTGEILGANADLAAQSIGGENYIKVTSRVVSTFPSTVKVGVTFNKIYSVTEGERYLFRVKGYTSGTFASLYVTANTGDLVWPGTSLSRQAISESWSEEEILIPAGVNQLMVGVFFSAGTGVGDNFFINQVEFYRLGRNSIPEYQFDLKDHLGNVRMTFSTQSTTSSFSAGFEDSNQAWESQIFANYPTGGNINSQSKNANSGSNSQHLYPGQAGVGRSFSVMPGDRLQIQAFAKYQNLSNTGSNLSGFTTSLLGAFGLSAPLAGEAHTAATALNAWGGLEAGGHADGGNDPMKVFVNIILFDKNYNFLDVSYQALDSSGAVMNASYIVKEPGYAYMYISNEHTKMVDVYFDDVQMQFTPSPIVSMQDYYPFGLVSQSFSAQTIFKSTLPNSYKYNGKEIQDELNLGWLDYGARMYMPEIGRWDVVDPLSEQFMSWGGYTYALNNPTTYIDIDGFLPGDPKYTGSGSVVIIIPDPGMEDTWDTSSLDNTKWDYGVFKSLTDAAKWLNSTYKRDGIKVKNIVIRTHGYVDKEDGNNSGLFIPGQPSDLLGRETLTATPRRNKNVLALMSIAKNLDQDARVLFTACNACMYTDKLGETLFHLMWGEDKNLKIFTNGATTTLQLANNKVKVRKTLNENIKKQYASWHITTRSGSSDLGKGKSPGLNTDGNFMWLLTGSGNSKGGKVQSPYHPHEFHGLE